MIFRMLGWMAGLMFLGVADIAPPSWSENNWLQGGAILILGTCFLFLLHDNAKARKDWLDQIAENNEFRRQDQAANQLMIDKMIEHCSARFPAIDETKQTSGAVS